MAEVDAARKSPPPRLESESSNESIGVIKGTALTVGNILVQLFPIVGGLVLKLIVGQHDSNQALSGFRRACMNPSEQNIELALSKFKNFCRSPTALIHSDKIPRIDPAEYLFDFLFKDIWIDLIVVMGVVMFGLSHARKSALVTFLIVLSSCLLLSQTVPAIWTMLTEEKLDLFKEWIPSIVAFVGVVIILSIRVIYKE